MKKYAQINIGTGEVTGVVNIQTEYSYPTMPTNGILYKELDSDTDDSTFAATSIWKNNQWDTRELRPSSHHVWKDYAWYFDSVKFWNNIRFKRATLLEECDWTQMADVSLDAGSLESWRTYRQLLREIPSTYSSATSEDDITWPTKPVSQGS